MTPRWKKVLLTIALIVLGLSCCAFLPCVRTVSNGGGRDWAEGNLRNIGIAVQSYHETRGRLPPAVREAPDGKPGCSWRVLLLPYVEMDGLFRQYRFDEPWDGPHNKELLERTPLPYDSAGDCPPGMTHFQVIVGPGTAFERAGLTWDDFPDGRANTLLVVEAEEPVPWTKPADLEFVPDGPTPAMASRWHKPVKFLCTTLYHRTGFNAVFADGTSGFIPSSTDERTIRALITRNGGEKVERPILR